MPLVVLEGIDGCGKSTQAQLLGDRLRSLGHRVRAVREPGGTALGEAMRRILLDPDTHACPVAELFGYLQARAQLCEEVLRPALEQGEVVVLDRFWHSTVAYQAYGLGLDVGRVRAANELAIGALRADVALWFDVDPEESQRRRAQERPDRIEARGRAYLERVREGYRALCAHGDLERIPADGEATMIAGQVWLRVSPHLARIS